MPIRIRESHIRATISDVQRHSNDHAGEQAETANQISPTVMRRIVDLVVAMVERRLQKQQQR